MTRNNLNAQISWLLQNRPLPTLGSYVTAPASSATFDGDSYEDDADAETQERTSELAPTPPCTSPARLQRMPDFSNTKVMQRSAQLDRSETNLVPVPQSMTTDHLSLDNVAAQGQFATPASSRPNRTPVPPLRSLMDGYTHQLRAQELPSDITVQKRHSDSMRKMHPPQTPKPTPLIPHVVERLKTVDAIDLTGDDKGECTNDSSSTDDVWGEPKLLWTEAAALRAEPHLRSWRKRKSDEISRGLSPHKWKEVLHRHAPVRDRRAISNEFVDIDAIDTSCPVTPQTNLVRSSPRRLDSIPLASEKNSEEYKLTGNISRSENHVRKTISRLVSGSEKRSEIEARAVPSLTQHLPHKSIVALSPGPHMTPHKPHIAQASVMDLKHASSQKNQKRLQCRVVQDSDEDNDMSDIENRIGISTPEFKQRTSVCQTPIASRLLDLTQCESTSQKREICRDQSSKSEGPLRPISDNPNLRQDKLLCPTSREPSRGSFPPSEDTPSHKTHQHLSPSAVEPLNQGILDLYFERPEALVPYRERVEAALSRNGAVSFERFLDKGETLPSEMVTERESLLNTIKTYSALDEAHQKCVVAVARKKKLVSRITHLGSVQGCTDDEEQLSLMLMHQVQEVKRVRVEMCRLLRETRAVDDGFGIERGLSPRNHTLKTEYGGSAEVILQTQIAATRDLPSHPSLKFQPLGTNYAAFSNLVSESIPDSPIHNCQQRVARTQPGGAIDLCIQRGIPASANIGNHSMDNESVRDPNDKTSALDGAVDTGEDDFGGCDDEDMLTFAQEVEKLRATRMTPSGLPLPQLRSQAKASPHSNMSSVPISMYSRAPLAHPDMMNHAWSTDVKKALKDRFGLRGFRQNQLEAINETLAGRDAFVLMPTGGGKSLCYQLPAVVQSGKTRGVTVVISPLLSLMNDQVDHLKKRRIQAVLLNGEIDKNQRNLVLNTLKDSHPEQVIQLLYVTPEMINRSNALLETLDSLHRRQKLARIVVDEAHCVSQWGHDFRPDYKAIGSIRPRFPGVPLIALTATATQIVKADIKSGLVMGNCKQLSQSFNRPNLFYEVRSKMGRSKKAVFDDMVELIQEKYAGQTGIIYTLSRDKTEDVAQSLVDRNISASHFHAAMPPQEKMRVQHQWQAGECQVVVATVAFGMGIDKPNVRFVVHMDLPKSLEGYYQETGRAGRDGKRSGCYLYFGYQDTIVLKRFINDSDGSLEVKQRQREMLFRMINFCTNEGECRRVQLLSYFGEPFDRTDCNYACDTCNSDATFEIRDVTSMAKAAVIITRTIEESKATLLQCVDILHGSKSAKYANAREIEGFGSARDLPRREVENLFYRLLIDDVLDAYHVVNGAGFATQYIKLGRKSAEFLKGGRRRLEMRVKVAATPKTDRNLKARAQTARTRTNPLVQKSQANRSGVSQPQSTILTSPITPTKHKSKYRKSHDFDEDFRDSYYNQNESDGLASDTSYFQQRRKRKPMANLGPPITRDNRMESLSDAHRSIVDSFIDAAKDIEERIRNHNGSAKKPYFTESQFREMVLRNTLTLNALKIIPGIDPCRVDQCGKEFIDLVRRYQGFYQSAMGKPEDRDIDRQHEVVIELSSDSEDSDLDASEMDDGISMQDGASRYFPNGRVNDFNAQMEQFGTLSQRRPTELVPAKKAPRNNSRGKGRFYKERGGVGGKSVWPASASGSGIVRSRASTTSGGISKKRASGSGRQSAMSKVTKGRSSKADDVMTKFAKQSGAPRMMPA